MSAAGRSGILKPSAVDMNRGMPNGAANSGPSFGASSLVTDANSALSGGPKLQRSSSINTESYMRLPSSPMSFSSNNISGSSIAEGSCIVQQEQVPRQGVSSATSQSTVQDTGNLLHPQKRARIDVRQGDILQQQILQQLLQRQDSVQFHGQPNLQLQAYIQQQRLSQQRQQQQLLQSLPLVQQVQMQQQVQQQQQQQQQLRQQMQQQQVMQPAYPVKRPIDNGICSRRLMQYMFHLRNRPAENSIGYWKKFVMEYFAPRARKKWCLSMYDNVSSQSLGVFPRAAMDAWHCEICGSKSGKGFEALYEVLPRLNQIKFDRGVIDEHFFLECPCEYRIPSGMFVLEYAKVIQETVYEQLRVVREGPLRIVFTTELKILSWEFCARRHEEFLSRRSLAPQVNQLLQVAQKYQTAVTESGSTGLSAEDLQSNCNLFAAAGRQIAKTMELQSLNDMGFSKRYVRCLQIAEVVNSMKDLIGFSQEFKMGPIESLKNYAKHAAAKLQNQKMQDEENVASQCLPDKQNMINKLIPHHPGLGGNNAINYTGNRDTAMTMGNYQNLLRNSLSENPGPMQPDASHSFVGSKPTQQVSFQNVSSIRTNQSSSVLSAPQQQQQQQQNNPQPSHGNQLLQQHAFQHLLLSTLANNNRDGSQHSLCSTNGISGGVASGAANVPGTLMRTASGLVSGMPNVTSYQAFPPLSRNNIFKSVPNNPAVSNSSYNSRPEITDNFHLPELDEDVTQEFSASGMFSSEPADIGYGWKV